MDVEGFKKVLRSEGFYANDVKLTVDDTQTPIAITYDIDAGPLFRITTFDIHFKDGKDIPVAPKLSDIGIEIGMPARAQAIIDAQTQIIVFLANRGFPYAKIDKQDAVVDFATDAMEVTLTLEAGPRLYMGGPQAGGIERS